MAAPRAARPTCSLFSSSILIHVLILPFLHSIPTCNSISENASSREVKKQNSSVPAGTCQSQGGAFLKFRLHGKQPRASPKRGSKQLTHCRVYKDLTCCGVENTDQAMVAYRKLAVTGDASDDCLAKWEALHCAHCHPLIGTQPGPPAICTSFCEATFQACRDAFFSTDAQHLALSSCGPRDSLCARAAEFASNGSVFCRLAGFDPQPEAQSIAAVRAAVGGGGTAARQTAGQQDPTAGMDTSAGRGEEEGDGLRRFGTGGGEEAVEGRGLQGGMRGRVCFDGSHAAGDLAWLAGLRERQAEGRKKKGGRKREEEEEEDEEEAGWLDLLGIDLSRPLGGYNVLWAVAGLVLTAGMYVRITNARNRRRRSSGLFAARKASEAAGLSRVRQQQQAEYDSSVRPGGSRGASPILEGLGFGVSAGSPGLRLRGGGSPEWSGKVAEEVLEKGGKRRRSTGKSPAGSPGGK